MSKADSINSLSTACDLIKNGKIHRVRQMSLHYGVPRGSFRGLVTFLGLSWFRNTHDDVNPRVFSATTSQRVFNKVGFSHLKLSVLWEEVLYRDLTSTELRSLSIRSGDGDGGGDEGWRFVREKVGKNEPFNLNTQTNSCSLLPH